jgi:branched-chain amino acid transport system substrate-binding protein
MQRTRLTRTCSHIAAFAVVAVAPLALASCGGSNGSGADGAPPALTVGVSLSLTGDFADPGRAALRGYQLWADTVNAQGGILGRQVDLTVLNDQSSPTNAARNYQLLITHEKVDFVLGPFSTLLTASSAPVVEQHGYAFIEPAGGGPSVFAERLNNLFFVQQAPVVKEGAVFADYILSLPPNQRPKTAAYTELDDPFAAPIAEYIRSMFQAAGIRTVYRATYTAQTTSLTPIMAHVAAARPDVLVSGTQSDDAYAEVTALTQVRFTPKWLFMSNGANSPTEFPDKVGANHVDGIMSSTDWFPDTASVTNANFVRNYLAKYGGTAENIDPTSAECFSAGMLLQDVARKTGRLDNATIIRSLHSGSWPTLVGNLSWNAYGEPRGNYTLVQWIDGELTPVFPSSRAQHAPIMPNEATARP